MIALLLALACVTPPSSPDCTAVSPVSAQAMAALQADGSLLITGEASHPDGLTIRSLWVGEQPAHNDGFNFDSWSATLSASTVQALSDQGQLLLELSALDACEVLTPIGVLTVDLPQSPPVVERLELTLSLPSGRSYLPADGSASASVDVRANPEAAGLAAHLSASTGVLGAEDGLLEVALDGDAHWLTTWTATGPGPALLGLTAGNTLSSAAVTVEGPPVFHPAQADIGPGAALGLAVDPRLGELASCTATGELGVSSGGTDLRQSPGGTDTDGDGLYDIFVTAPLDSPPGQQAVIQCADVYGQTTQAVVTRR